jgi:cell division protein FtsI/penicillin-binding protein 2
VDVEITPDHVIGRTGTARLTVEEYNGKKRNKVAAWIVGTAKPAQPQAPRRNDNEPF